MDASRPCNPIVDAAHFCRPAATFRLAFKLARHIPDNSESPLHETQGTATEKIEKGSDRGDIFLESQHVSSGIMKPSRWARALRSQAFASAWCALFCAKWLDYGILMQGELASAGCLSRCSCRPLFWTRMSSQTPEIMVHNRRQDTPVLNGKAAISGTSRTVWLLGVSFGSFRFEAAGGTFEKFRSGCFQA